MKLSDALEHQERIKRMTAELNMVINEAVTDGMFVTVDIMEYQTLSIAGITPKIETTVKVNPQDIESL